MTEEQGGPSEEELAAAFEEQLRRLTPLDVILQAAVSLINLAGRRLGLDPASAGERDLEQARDGIDGARALMTVLDRREDAETLQPLRDALSALQLHYARLAGPGGAPPPGPAGATEPPAPAPPAAEEEPGGAGPAQRSGRLWIPGQ
jgi:hypothetical protein